jgi:hypothetical protein
VGLLREGAEIAEAEARAIEPRRWLGVGTAHFIRVDDEPIAGENDNTGDELNPE